MYIADYPSDVPASRVYGTAAHDRARMAKLASSVPLRRAVAETEVAVTPPDLLKHYAEVRARLESAASSRPQKAAEEVQEIVSEQPAVVHCKEQNTTPEFWYASDEPIQVYCAAIANRDWVIIDRRITCDRILSVATQHFGMSRTDLRSQRRTADVVLARQIIMYLMKSITLRSLPDIGRRMGGRDHTTVLHAVRKITGMIEAGHERVIADVAGIKAALGVTE